jgi:hypothetical protein
MCFGKYIAGEDVNEGLTDSDETFDETAYPFVAKNGVFCIAYYSADGNTINAAISSRKVSWHGATEWNGNYSFDSDSGLELTGESYGRVDTPNVDNTADSDGYQLG